MFLTHFVGDIHQPLHCARKTDRGGNSIHVHFLDEDDALIEKERANNRDHYARPDEIIRKSKDDVTYHLRRHRQLSDSTRRHHNHDGLNLHAVWDDNIIDIALARDYENSRNAFELNLLNLIWKTKTTLPDEWHEKWLKCAYGGRKECTIVWGEESLEYALRYAYRNVDGSEIVDGTNLTDGTYYESRLPIVRERLAIAAVRLAITLEVTFDPTAKSTK
jgi:hypothetical protein